MDFTQSEFHPIRNREIFEGKIIDVNRVSANEKAGNALSEVVNLKNSTSDMQAQYIAFNNIYLYHLLRNVYHTMIFARFLSVPGT